LAIVLKIAITALLQCARGPTLFIQYSKILYMHKIQIRSPCITVDQLQETTISMQKSVLGKRLKIAIIRMLLTTVSIKKQGQLKLK